MSSARMLFFTITTPSHAAQARVLLQSLRRRHGDTVDLAVFMVAEERHEAAFAGLDAVVLGHAALGVPHYYDLALRYPVTEFCCALKPVVAAHFARDRQRPAIVYLDSDMEALKPLTAVLDPIAQGAAMVLSPHRLLPAQAGDFPDEIGFLRSGSYNAGVFAVAPGPRGDAILDWWAARLAKDGTTDAQRGTYADQKWLDLVPVLFEGVHLLRDPAINVAYWNLAERARLLSARSGDWLSEIGLFHYSRWFLNSWDEDAYTARLIPDPVLAAEIRPLLQRYRDQWLGAARPSGAAASGDYLTLPDGSPITPLMRSIYADRATDAEPPRDWASAQARLLAILNENDSLDGEPEDAPLTRFQAAYLAQASGVRRPDFDGGTAAGRRAFRQWLVREGISAGIPACLTAPIDGQVHLPVGPEVFDALDPAVTAAILREVLTEENAALRRLLIEAGTPAATSAG